MQHSHPGALVPRMLPPRRSVRLKLKSIDIADLPAHLLTAILLSATDHDDLLRHVGLCALVCPQWWEIVRISPAYGAELPRTRPEWPYDPDPERTRILKTISKALQVAREGRPELPNDPPGWGKPPGTLNISAATTRLKHHASPLIGEAGCLALGAALQALDWAVGENHAPHRKVAAHIFCDITHDEITFGDWWHKHGTEHDLCEEEWRKLSDNEKQEYVKIDVAEDLGDDLEVYISNGTEVDATDEPLKLWPASAIALTDIDLSGCQGLTPAGIAPIVTAFRRGFARMDDCRGLQVRKHLISFFYNIRF